jgi:hypothetical protein
MQQHQIMRTTLDLEGDVLQAAKEIDAKEPTTAGAVISRWRGSDCATAAGKSEVILKNGVPVFLPVAARSSRWSTSRNSWTKRESARASNQDDFLFRLVHIFLAAVKG